jgi:alpha,alpha-trehalase
VRRCLALSVSVAWALFAAASFAAEPSPGGVPEPPSVEFGELYQAVEMAGLYPDQKTFADAIPDKQPAQLLADYERQKRRAGFDLKAFVSRHFALPPRRSPGYEIRSRESIGDYIARMWKVLQRQPDEAEAYSSLLPLPRPYVVPGGRFSEIYYWDTYFTMLGLERDGRHELALDMLENMASLIDRYDHVPNGNRSYYLSRSQPPFFSAMVELIAARDGDAVVLRYLPEMQAEYEYWMEGAKALAPGTAHRHVVRLRDGTVLNRYWDDRAVPRDESYRADVETARWSGRAATQVYRDLRAGAETGWDFSSRWLADGKTLGTIRTTSLAPVDLNALMVHLERMLAKAYRLRGAAAQSRFYEQQADRRAGAVRRLMWNGPAGVFCDYLWEEERPSDTISAATVFPLYFGIATEAQAHAVAATLRRSLLEPGGLGTTSVRSGQQWDRPNGWAPMQWLAINGLAAYGEDSLARDIARRWLRKNVDAYEQSGALLEKYDVETVISQHGGGGGEYPLQVGFGWTNGVLADLMARYPREAAEALRQPGAVAP